MARKYASRLIESPGCGAPVASGSFASKGVWVDNVRTLNRLVAEHCLDADTDALRPARRCECECEWCGWTKQLVTDHCHGCGRVRGTLCRICNASEARGHIERGWHSKCDGQPFYRDGWGYRDVTLSPQLCGGTDAFAVELRDWWRSEHPELWLEVRDGNES